MSWRAWAITAWTSVVFILATLPLSNPGDERSVPRASSSIIELLMMPLGRSQPAELRLWVLPIGLAGLLLIFAAFPRRAPEASKPPLRNKKNRSVVDDAPPGFGGSMFSAFWLELLAVATIAIAMASAVFNDSWLLSRGWILQLAAGCGWAVLISRMADRRCIERIVPAASFIAIIAAVLSFGHRQSHHVEFFAWPIGPVTMTAGMAVLWGSFAIGMAIGLIPRSARAHTSWRNLCWTGVVILSAVALLVIAARRGAWLAVLAAGGYSAIVVAWRYGRTRRRRWVVLSTAAVVSVLAAVYVVAQSRSADPRASIPINYRLIYWKNTVAHLADAWLLGHGPDMFLCKMSAIIAGERARMPRVLHGTIDPEAHNEWLQAIFELGLPGGLLYLAIPLIAVILATRAWLRSAESGSSALLLSFATGITAVVMSEASSICLRRGGMNIWYWTLIGATIAWARLTTTPVVGKLKLRPVVTTTARLAAVAVAMVICFIVFEDGRRRVAHARGAIEKGRDDRKVAENFAKAGWRLGAWQALAARADLGDAQLAVAQDASNDPAQSRRWASQAADTWRSVYERCPGYPGAAYRLAQSLQLSGDATVACDVLKRYLTAINPYEMPANNLYVASCSLGPRETLEHVRRGLRDGEWMAGIETKLASAFESPDVNQEWPRQVLAAMEAVNADSMSGWADTPAPETLRIEAARFAATGNYAFAVRMQSIAVQAYSRLEREQSPYRRAAFAEADASLRCAMFIFADDPSRHADALQRLREAERLAASGLPQRAVANADPRSEWIGGRIVPAEFPPRLRPLWRYAAMLHLAGDSDLKLVQQRIEWSLPEDRQSPNDAIAQLHTIASELVRIFKRIDPDRRPSNYDHLVALANQAGIRPPAPAPGR